MCREHFVAFARQQLRKTLAIMYKSADIAYGVLDPEGVGYLNLKFILGSYVAKRCGLTPEEITAYFEMQNVFQNGEGRLCFAKFRELFFPHHTLAGEDIALEAQSTKEIKTKEQRAHLTGKLQTRIRKLNEQICHKISNNFTSVNKAFLTIDQNHDGLIEPKDIVSLYGSHITIEYADLVKIMESVNSKADGSGTLNYNDFSRWMGNEIHNLASFIFRHDSKRNPQYEMHLKKQELEKGKDKKIAAE